MQDDPPESERAAGDRSPSAPWPTGLTIRARGLEDAAGIAALHNMPGFRNGTLRLPYHSVEEIRRGIESTPQTSMALVAVLDGLIVGDIGLTRYQGRRSHTGSIGMGVHDDFTARGIGAALLGEIVEAADRWLGLARLELTVFTDNRPAIRLYERFGFEREGHLRAFAFRNGNYADAYAMARLRA